MNSGCIPTKPSPHIQGRQKSWGKHRDYNGTGRWSVEGIQQRYLEYAREAGLSGVEAPRPIHSVCGDESWTFPVMDEVIERLKQADPAAIALAIDMIEEDDFFCFGQRIKCYCSHGLRRVHLIEQQRQRIRVRLVSMLLTGWVPYEFLEYRRLLRKVGVGELWPLLDAQVNRANPYVMRHYRYLDQHSREAPGEVN